jgi:hypothetical protein
MQIPNASQWYYWVTYLWGWSSEQTAFYRLSEAKVPAYIIAKENILAGSRGDSLFNVFHGPAVAYNRDNFHHLPWARCYKL